VFFIFSTGLVSPFAILALDSPEDLQRSDPNLYSQQNQEKVLQTFFRGHEKNRGKAKHSRDPAREEFRENDELSSFCISKHAFHTEE